MEVHETATDHFLQSNEVNRERELHTLLIQERKELNEKYLAIIENLSKG
jgi:hypothetical protein